MVSGSGQGMTIWQVALKAPHSRWKIFGIFCIFSL
jgi:hypothetical protein